MKTTVLIMISVIAFGINAMAQKQGYSVAKKEVKIRTQNTLDLPSSNTNVTPVVTHIEKPKKTGIKDELELVPIGSSRNGFSVLLPQQRCLWYDKNLNALACTFRGNEKPTVSPVFATGNDIVSSTSTSRGSTWNSKIILPAGTTKTYRYPSGCFLNPTGNTDINNAVNFVAGPTSIASVWAEYYFASKLYDGSSANLQNFQMPIGAPGLLRNSLFACEDGTVHILVDTDDDPSANVQNGRTIVRNGTFNPSTKAVEWASEVVIIPTISSDVNGQALSSGATRMTWTNDGSVGYITMVGIDASGTRNALYPIIYKSTDKGATWQKLPYFDFSSLEVLEEYLFPAFSPTGQREIVVPRFDDFDITISADGNLNIMASIRGHFYENNIDSIYYIFTGEHHNVFNFVYDGNSWNSYFIQRLATFGVTAETTPYSQSTTGAGAVTYDLRIHAVRSYDAKKIFALWTNTLPTNSNADSNDIRPDLFVWGYNIGNGNVITQMSEPLCPTTFQVADGICYFMYTSPICMEASGGEEFPVVIVDLETTGYNADEPCILNYVKNIIVPDSLFQDIRDAVRPAKDVSAVVTRNYPNPFRGITKVDITLKKTVPVNVVVTTLTGQKVLEKDYGILPVGSETLIINASGLNSGIYIYTVTAGNSKSSYKMIVK